jgi:hypothetical protein
MIKSKKATKRENGEAYQENRRKGLETLFGGGRCSLERLFHLQNKLVSGQKVTRWFPCFVVCWMFSQVVSACSEVHCQQQERIILADHIGKAALACSSVMPKVFPQHRRRKGWRCQYLFFESSDFSLKLVR